MFPTFNEKLDEILNYYKSRNFKDFISAKVNFSKAKNTKAKKWI
jgi:hypothetical protein